MKYFEDYSLEETRVSTGRTVTETDIMLHCGQSGDFYPHHVDVEFCKTQSFGKRIAHGTLVFTIAVGMTAAEINPLAFSYGYDRLRFVRPVFIGNTITTTVSISEKRDHKKPGFGIVVEKLVTKNQNDEVVLACEHLLMVERQENSTSSES